MGSNKKGFFYGLLYGLRRELFKFPSSSFKLDPLIFSRRVHYNSGSIFNPPQPSELKEKSLDLKINDDLVRQLIKSQFPRWKNLDIRRVEPGGYDNKTFRLGNDMLIRMPTTKLHAGQVQKEQKWLPKIAPFLPLPIPVPLAIGEKTEDYPWQWSIYRWIDGKSADFACITNINDFAKDLAQFLRVLQSVDTTDGPLAGIHSFYRGGALSTYNSEVKEALLTLRKAIDVSIASEIWQTALATSWSNKPVWVHGDISRGNLLVKHGKLSAVIDFGQLAIGDPACDLAIAFTFFKGESREIFRNTLLLDADTWARGRAWTLWKALILAAKHAKTNAIESTQALQTIQEVFDEHELFKRHKRVTL